MMNNIILVLFVGLFVDVEPWEVQEQLKTNPTTPKSLLASVPDYYKLAKRIYESMDSFLNGKDKFFFEKEYEDFKRRYDKNYKTTNEETLRYLIWLYNFSLQLISDPTQSEQVIDYYYDKRPGENLITIGRK